MISFLCIIKQKDILNSTSLIYFTLAYEVFLSLSSAQIHNTQIHVNSLSGACLIYMWAVSANKGSDGGSSDVDRHSRMTSPCHSIRPPVFAFVIINIKHARG